MRLSSWFETRSALLTMSGPRFGRLSMRAVSNHEKQRFILCC